MLQFKYKVYKKIARIIILFIQKIRIIFYQIISSGTRTFGDPVRHQPLHCHGCGKLFFGKNVHIGYYPSPNFFGVAFLDVRNKNASIVFGDNVFANNGLTIIAEEFSVKIGDRVLIGPNVTIFDSDFHGISIADRNNSEKVMRGSVIVGDDVFIGEGSILLKGVTIGNGAVIAAKSVVTSSIEPNVIAAGNPARKVRAI